MDSANRRVRVTAWSRLRSIDTLMWMHPASEMAAPVSETTNPNWHRAQRSIKVRMEAGRIGGESPPGQKQAAGREPGGASRWSATQGLQT